MAPSLELPAASKLARRINDMIGFFSPGRALARETASMQRGLLQVTASHYQGAGRGARSKDFRANKTDAIEASRGDRSRMSWIARDMLRNNPRVVKIRRQLISNVIGPGIQPSVRWLGETSEDRRRGEIEGLIRDHCLTTDFDVDGLQSMLGMQALGFGSIVLDGEVLYRRRYRPASGGYKLNFQVQALEADFLDQMVDGPLSNGNYAVLGIEFNKIGKRVAYHLYEAHPGSRRGGALVSRRIPAEHVIHAFDPVRPGQVRGVSWLAPVVTLLHELQKYQDGQVKRQEIAALFAAVLKTDEEASALENQTSGLTPGAVMTIGSDESIDFTDPPSVDGYEPFMRVTDRVIASAMGITYESLNGDYSNVNYTSGRMARMDVDPNIKGWQNNLMIANVCNGFGRWIKEAVEDVADIPPGMWDLVHTPPTRPVVDPTKDYKANETAILSGQKSRRQVIREQGGDPQKIETELREERGWERDEGLLFSSNAATKANSGGEPPDQNTKDEQNGKT